MAVRVDRRVALDELGRGFGDAAVGLALLGVNGFSLGKHVLRVQHTFDRPAQIDGSRTGSAHARYRGLELRIVGDLRAQERYPICCEDADARRTAHGERPYRVFEFFSRGRAPHDRFMRNRTLIDVFDRVAGPANGFRCFER